MDEMNIISKFTTGLCSKVISMILSKKLGCRIHIKLDRFNMKVDEEKACIQLNGEAEIGLDELKKLLANTGLLKCV